MPASFLTPLLRSPATAWVLRNQRNSRPLATRLETAFESHSRRTGLLGRSSLDEQTALVLAPCSAIHTFFMRFPIDVLFVDRHGCVLRIAETLAPWRIAWAARAFAVVELRAHAIRMSDTRVADVLHLTTGSLSRAV